MRGHLGISSTDDQKYLSDSGELWKDAKRGCLKSSDFLASFSVLKIALKHILIINQFFSQWFFFSGLRGENLIFSFWWHQWWPLPETNHISVPDVTAVLAFTKMDTTAVARKKPSGNPPYTFLSTKPYLADVFWKASPLNGAFWREIMTSLFLLMLLDLEHWVHCVNWK